MPRDKVFEKMISSAKRAPLWHVMQLRKYKNRKKKNKIRKRKRNKKQKTWKNSWQIASELAPKSGRDRVAL